MHVEDDDERNALQTDRLSCSGKMKQVDALRIAVILVFCFLSRLHDGASCYSSHYFFNWKTGYCEQPYGNG